MKDTIAKLLFVLAFAAVFFIYGYVSRTQEIFPHRHVNDAGIALSAALELFEDDGLPINVDFFEPGADATFSATSLAATAGTEHVFILGNDAANFDDTGGRPRLAWVTDREGTVLHAWPHPDADIWAPLTNRESLFDQWASYPVGGHVFANGDILVSYQGEGVFPIAMGLARFDKDGELLWKRDGFYHHWFSVSENGDIYAPSLVVANSPFKVRDHDKRIECEDGRFTYDTITVLSPDGETQREIDLMDALIDSGLAGVINNSVNDRTVVHSCDPLHLNSVTILGNQQLADFPTFEKGDLLLSFRSLNGVGVLDPDTERFRWFRVGVGQRQHSARFFRDAEVLMFDNHGGRPNRGTSRIATVNTLTGAVGQLFPREEGPPPHRPFMSPTAGHVDISEDRQRILVSWSHRGLVWEIDADSGQVLWEWVNTHRVDGKAARINVYTATYVDGLRFAMNAGRLD